MKCNVVWQGTRLWGCLGLLVFLWSGAVFAQDLQVTGLTSNVSLPKFGQEITLTVTVENKSFRTAGASVLGIYYSQNSTISTSDPRIATVNVPQLRANGKNTSTVKVKVPPYYGSGQRWMGAIADYNSRVRETNENNNTRALALTVQLGTAPDLAPTALTLSKTTVASGDKITASFTISNIGNQDAPKTTATFRLSTNTTISTQDTKIVDVSIPALKAGTSYKGTATLTIPAASGTRYLGIFVDPHALSDVAGAIPEVNESNNTRYVRVTVTTPDLVPDSLVVSPSVFKANDTITLSLVVRNTGQTDARASTLGFYFSTNTSLSTRDRQVKSVSVPIVKAGGSVTVSTTLQVTGTMLLGYTSSFYVLANVDDKNVLQEGNESNNVTSYRVNANGVDLIVTKFAVTPTPAVYAQNEEVTVAFTVRNNGNRTANASATTIHYSIDANFSVNDTRLATVNTPSLAAGKEYSGTVKVRIPNNATQGSTRYLFAYADGLRRLSETNNSNNAKGISFVVGFVNFAATAVALSPTSGKRGDKVTLTYTIKNTGNKAAPSSVVGIYWSLSSFITTSSTRLTDQRIPSIAAGKEYKGTVSLTVPSSARTGRIYFGVYADRNRQISESNESSSDNGKSAPFTVVSNIDLQPTKVTPSKTTVQAGERILVRVDVKNNGTDASGSFYTGLFYSTDSKYDSSDSRVGVDLASSLSGGSSRTIQAYVSIPQSASGTIYILAFVDYNTRISETNENNNVLAVKLTVQKKPGPDVTPTVVAPSASQAKAGDKVSVKVTVKNIGTTTTGKAAAVSLYLSTNTTLGSRDTFLGTATQPVLAANAQAVITINVTVPATASAGNYYLIAFADAQRGIAESNENNNTKAQAFSVVTKTEPDLVAQSMGIQPTSAQPGDSIKVLFTLRNIGAAASGSASYTIYFAKSSTPSSSDVTLKTQTFAPLGPGLGAAQTQTVTVPNTAQPGTYYIRVFVDSTKVVAESNESNNNSTAALTVKAKTEPTPEPTPEPTTEPKPEPVKEPVTEPAPEPAPEPTKEPVKEPAPEPPTPDAGPVDVPQGCPGGCPAGEVCINNRCVPVVMPDNDETTPEDEAGDTEAGDTEPTVDGGPADNAPDASPADNPTQETAQETAQETVQEQATDQTQTQDNAPDTSTTDTTTPGDSGGQEGSNKEGGTANDTGTNLPEVPAVGCGCELSSGSPWGSLAFFLAVVALLTLRRRRSASPASR